MTSFFIFALKELSFQIYGPQRYSENIFLPSLLKFDKEKANSAKQT